MFWYQFWLNNLHFAGELFITLTSVLVIYVLVLVWREKGEKKIALRALGFVLFALFSVVHIAGGGGRFAPLELYLEFLAFLLIGISFFIDPIQLPPATPLAFVSGDFLRDGLRFANLVLLAGLAGRLYRKYTRGLEKELKNLFRGFIFLFFSEALSALALFKGSSYIVLSSLTTDFGPIWIITNALKLFGFIFIAIWAWGYLRFKLFSQVVGAFVVTSLFIFISITFVYTSLLVGVVQRNSLENLETNLRTFEYAVEKIKGQAVTTASVVASNPTLKKYLKEKGYKNLSSFAKAQIHSSGVDFLAITDKRGVVLARGEDPEVVGDSLSANFVVSSALEGESEINVTTREWVNAPQILIEASVPINGSGAVYTGYILDNAFVDGVKETTGLDVTVFGGEVKSATTLIAADGVSRLVGVRQTDGRIKSKVQEEGELFLGLSSVFQREFLSAYGPLKDTRGEILGMLFVGYPSVFLFEAAQNSLDTTFLASTVLALLSFVPAYLLAKYIEEHQV